MFTTTLDTRITQPSFTKVRNAFDKRDYQDTIEKATITLEQIQKSQLIVMLDRRSYAFGMKGKYDMAIKDAKTMIEYGGLSMMSHGYLRLGNLLESQGKYGAAIQLYQEALEKLSTPDNDYCGYKQLMQAKITAEKKNNQRFDIISALPYELCDEIIGYLTEKEKATVLLDVSPIWHRQISNCQKTWAEISNNHNEDNGEIMVARAIPYIAEYIKNLTLKTNDKKAMSRYINHMEDGRFKSLQSLEITDEAIFYLIDTANSTLSLKKSFWIMQNTLTKLRINYNYEYSTLKLSDILYNCHHLKILEVISMDSFTDFLGDLECLQEAHLSLVDITLGLEPVSGESIRQLTKWCPNIRRLILEGATSCTVDVVCNCFPNLEIFGYNPGRIIPELGALNRAYDRGERTVNEQEQGLRGIFTRYIGYGVPEELFIPLLEKNQKTLERLYINMSKTKEQKLRNGMPSPAPDPSLARIRARYQCLKFDRLESLVCESDAKGVYESIFLKSSGSSLKRFCSVFSPKISTIADILITRPPFHHLKFSRIEYFGNEDARRQQDAYSMIRLFKSYAAISLPGSENRFEKFRCEYNNFISDAVLDVLAEIKTLKDIYIDNDCNISNQGLKNFLYKLNENDIKVTKLGLAGFISEVDDDLLVEIVRNLKSLEALYLCRLRNITANGIKNLVDNAKGLRYLNITFCYNINRSKDDVISYVKKNSTKVKNLRMFPYAYDECYEEFEVDI
ncbi:hypothetical protein BDA99DRAFT_513933 [Phascolomyces articulosus]|uniref:F-box domain-containing protein n=1 Tax=Phascolomyces articulosus TaxID=60185 RepID=A0AAD5JYG1_9FUNG|nr:hypothetical protein BDA99DRAFT_513933 [Phascolomyces articulosus]